MRRRSTKRVLRAGRGVSTRRGRVSHEKLGRWLEGRCEGTFGQTRLTSFWSLGFDGRRGGAGLGRKERIDNGLIEWTRGGEDRSGSDGLISWVNRRRLLQLAEDLVEHGFSEMRRSSWGDDGRRSGILLESATSFHLWWTHGDVDGSRALMSSRCSGPFDILSLVVRFDEVEFDRLPSFG